ncbi:helicase HerA domain-containing protein, partial [Alistipes putredinis]
IRLTDRRNGIPVHVDISDEPMRRGIITNRNKFILGPSGSGKSFFTNHLVRNYYEQGAHVLLVDTGNSYRGLCSLVNGRTHGGDGIYITYE